MKLVGRNTFGRALFPLERTIEQMDKKRLRDDILQEGYLIKLLQEISEYLEIKDA